MSPTRGRIKPPPTPAELDLDLAKLDTAEELAAVEVLGGQDAQLVEDGGQGLLGLVDDQHERVV